MTPATSAHFQTKPILGPRHPLRLSKTVTLSTITYWYVDTIVAFLL